MSAIKWTINKKMWVLVIASLISGIAVFIFLYMISNQFFDRVMEGRDTPQKTIDALQQYLTEENVSTGDLSPVEIWCRRNREIEVEIFVDGKMAFSSIIDLSENEYDIHESEQEKDMAISMVFADRSADVLFYDYLHWYDRALVVNIAASLFVFLLFFFTGMRGEIARIVKLGEEVQNLEGGDLTQEITLQGDDEIALLAESMEGFRESMVDKLATIRELERNNRQMSAEIAHDLRTPLTSLIMYLDFARGEIDGQMPQADYYLDKAKEKSVVLKNLLEENFSFISMDPGNEKELKPMPAYEVLSGLLGDMTTYLESEGFYVRAEVSYGQSSIWINREAAGRVFSNLLSNMMKYATRSAEVYVGCKEAEQFLEIRLVNLVRVYDGDRPQSTGFGSRIVQRLMGSMQGEYIVNERDGHYETVLRFLKA